MGAKVSKNQHIVLNKNEDIIEYQGYEEFAIVEIAKNNTKQQDKIKPNPSLNNHSGGSSIGKYESEHDPNKLKDKSKDDNNEEEKIKIESKFPHNNNNQELTNHIEEEDNIENKNENKEEKNNLIIINNNDNYELNNNNENI